MFSVVIHGQTFCSAFAFVITRSFSDWIHVAPVFFCLRVLQGVAVDFRRGRDEEACTTSLGKTQEIERTEKTCFDGFDGVVLVVNWGCWASKVVYLVYFEEDGFDDVVADELEIVFV